jgi:hypothetical protein
MLERLIEHINTHDGVGWLTFEQVVDSSISRSRERKQAREHP